jgi:hypothetical protein
VFEELVLTWSRFACNRTVRGLLTRAHERLQAFIALVSLPLITTRPVAQTRLHLTSISSQNWRKIWEGSVDSGKDVVTSTRHTVLSWRTREATWTLAKVWFAEVNMLRRNYIKLQNKAWESKSFNCLSFNFILTLCVLLSTVRRLTARKWTVRRLSNE